MENWPNFGAAFDGIGEFFQRFRRRGEVCKTFMRRFDPDPRLHHFNNLDILSETLDRAAVVTFVGVYAATYNFERQLE